MLPASVRFESVTPRDAALVVLEELSLSSAFRSWLLDAIGLETGSVTTLEARDSLGGAEMGALDADRLSVLEVALERPGERVGLLLTVATDFDAETDRARLERVRTRRDRPLEGQRDDCRVVSLAPAAALEETATDTERTTDATVSLEALRDRFAASDTDRGEFRAALVAAAIERGRESTAGGPRSVDAYRSLAAEREPAFEFRADPDLETGDGEVNPNGPTVAIDAPSLAEDHLLVHGLADGTVDLRIPGAAAHLRPFAARYASAIPPATELLTDGDALVLRLSVPAIDDDSGADGDGIDETAVDEALTAVRDLVAVSERVDERSS